MTPVVSTERQVIHVRLNSADEMYELASTDLFSEFRNYLTGIDMCLSELRSRTSSRPVTVVVDLPPSEVDPDTARHLGRTLRSYCDQRLAYDRRERRALRLDGLTALRIGLPIAGLGMVLSALSTHLSGSSEVIERTIGDHIGWVLAWLGLWFPLDMLLFYPHQYGRESRALARLRDAEIVVRARPRGDAPGLAPASP